MGVAETTPLIAPATIARRSQGREVPRALDPARRRVLRCAIYSRVSTDEQAALEYNSLQAQEEICAGYVAMRGRDPGADAAWQVADTYRDVGYSGGTLERPALRRLMQDVEAGRIQVVVVYKIDRLSRSIHQFYRTWEVFQHHGVDLVSATQDLNTSSSQGKLMLNMLLSFGQFEREQIGERTRDKIRAARRRGMWTGGHVPMGYDLRDGRLVVNEAETDQVRVIVGRYLETLSLTRTVEELDRLGLTMKTGAHQNGSIRSGRPFDKPSLLRLLRNPVYAGLSRCNGSLAEGEHDAILPRETWERVQDRLTRNGTSGYQGSRVNHVALLKGLLHCACCDCSMSPTYSVKGSRKYRYYVCQSVLKRGARSCPTGRVPAQEIEQRVVEQIRAIGRDPELVAETARQAHAQIEERRALLDAERRQQTRELGHQKAAMKRLNAGPSRNGDSAERVADVRAKIQAIETRLASIAQEAEADSGLEIDERDVARALEAFGPVWDSLWPAERSRIMTLLTEGISYDGRVGTIAVRLRADGIRSIGQPEPA